ncbi:G3E family GTPase [Cryobacterium sp. MP_M5]|uniref:GTP-binding protein n=1 Tax=unclassified Cryobacterium TaxID=2649013 RepID=UPI0018CA8939|nr:MULTISPECIES: GTP-binding protein [unclassified Cryobacterium]MBG6060076.1 G3E family GTPase [Cryobacterium sp. MP_M3]MEC5178494.1 G3E family GTPase [Cryobacterium sp. MP_M5]
MKAHPFLTVNLVSGLTGSGKSSTARASGAATVGLSGADQDAIAMAIAHNHGRSEVMLELHPSAGPLEVAIAVLAAANDGTPFPELRRLRLGSFVSVLDASRFWRDIRSDALAPLPPVACASHGEHDRTVADALVEQIEWASVVVINKTDLADQGECADLRDFVRLLNPASHVIFARHGHSAISPWLPPREDMLAWLQQSPGWIRQLNGEGLLASSTSGLRCAVYRDPRPFHPGRLAAFLAKHSDEAGEILRSRGLFRLATRPYVVGSWNSAGPTIAFEPTSMGSHDPQSPWGQEIAFFGVSLDATRLTRNLNACLLTDQEFIGGPMYWSTLADPFPSWDLGHT